MIQSFKHRDPILTIFPSRFQDTISSCNNAMWALGEVAIKLQPETLNQESIAGRCSADTLVITTSSLPCHSFRADSGKGSGYPAVQRPPHADIQAEQRYHPRAGGLDLPGQGCATLVALLHRVVHLSQRDPR